MKSCFDIVPYFLKVSYRGARGGMTPLKLQKLLYYSQAWYLVFRDRPLFWESIEAWVHGPVVPDVYRKFKHFGYSKIRNQNMLANDYINEQEKLVLNLVWNTYGNQQAKYLEYLTHSEYPWMNARRGLAENQSSSREISLNEMKQYYSQFVSSVTPPRIHSNALKLHGEKLQPNKLQNVLSGVGSILDIFPAYQSNNDYYSPDDFSDELNDCESLQSDWESIGLDFLSTMESAKKSQRRENDQIF